MGSRHHEPLLKLSRYNSSKKIASRPLQFRERRSESWCLASWLVLNDFLIPEWIEFNKINVQEIKSKALVLVKDRRYRYSIPDWLDHGVKAYGEITWEKETYHLIFLLI